MTSEELKAWLGMTEPQNAPKVEIRTPLGVFEIDSVEPSDGKTITIVTKAKMYGKLY